MCKRHIKKKDTTGGIEKNESVKKVKADAEEKEVFCHWLMKSEPDSRIENGVDVKFGLQDLESSPNGTACWDGVRNYQARNFMRDQMKVGQSAFFYHSNCKEPGIAGVMKIVKESYPDHTQFDKKDLHYDSSASLDNPRWFMVDVKYERTLKKFIKLSELKKLHLEHKQSGGALKDIALFTKARLSVQPIRHDVSVVNLEMSCKGVKACYKTLDINTGAALFNKDIKRLCRGQKTFIECMEETFCQCGQLETTHAKSFLKFQRDNHKAACVNDSLLRDDFTCQQGSLNLRCSGTSDCQAVTYSQCNSVNKCECKQGYVYNSTISTNECTQVSGSAYPSLSLGLVLLTWISLLAVHRLGTD